MCFYICKATLSYYPLQTDTIHIHLCSGSKLHRWPGVREETGRSAPSSQLHPSPFATGSQLCLEEGRTEILISSYLAEGSMTCLVQIPADNREDEGWTSGKECRMCGLLLQRSRMTSASLEATHTSCRTHKAVLHQSAWGLLTLTGPDGPWAVLSCSLSGNGSLVQCTFSNKPHHT